MADMDCLFMWKAGVSSADYRVHFMGVNRLSACREFFGVHSWQNGTRCSVVLFPSCLAGFLRFHSCMCLFSFKKRFCDLGLKAQAKPHEPMCKAHEFYEALHTGL